MTEKANQAVLDIPAKTLIVIQGPMCGGKTTLVSRLMLEKIGVYLVDFDEIKRQLSGYHYKRDWAFGVSLTRKILNSVAEMQRPMLCLPPPLFSQAEYDAFFEEPLRNDYTIVPIWIDAPKEVRKQRYEVRLQEHCEQPRSYTIMTMEDFLAQQYVELYRPPGAHVLDTSVFDESGVCEQVRSIIVASVDKEL